MHCGENSGLLVLSLMADNGTTRLLTYTNTAVQQEEHRPRETKNGAEEDIGA
jgi:hypothetical protein